MPGGLQALRRRIRSVQNTSQITRAMKMVAGAKLRRAEERARQSRDYFEAIRHITARAVAAGASQHPLLVERPVTTSGFLVITSDRGLAGPYNANVMRHLMQFIGSRGIAREHTRFFVAGRKGRDFLRARGFQVAAEFMGLGDDPAYRQAQAIADRVVKQYLEGSVDAVYLSFTEYQNALVQHPRTLRLLPVESIQQEAVDAGHKGAESMVFEPDAADVLNTLIPRYIEVLIYGALLQSKASEQGARMTAMDSASKNAEELIRRMVLQRNRIRQAIITKEIAELVGGAEALS